MAMCELCGTLFANEEDLLDHLEEQHKEDVE